MVQITDEDRRWTGIIVDSGGYILTTSDQLRASPLVSVRMSTGQTVEGWVWGRDDDKDLALIKVRLTDLPAAELGDSSQVGEETQLAVVGFPTLTDRLSFVRGQFRSFQRGSPPDRLFIETTAEFLEGMQGGPVINRLGQVVGIQVSNASAADAKLPDSSGGFAMAINSAQPLIPQLQAGLLNVTARPLVGPVVNPPIPATYQGSFVFQDGTAPEGAVIYVRIQQTGQPDYWNSATVLSPTQYLIGAAPPTLLYAGGSVEFWMRFVKADVTSIRASFPGTIVRCSIAGAAIPVWASNDSCTLDLAFP